MATYGDSSSRAPSTPPNPRSSLDTHELDEWITIQFQCNPTVDTVQCVPTLTLLNSLSPLNPSTSFQQNEPLTEDQIVQQCRAKFFQILEHHFAQESIGAGIKFLPCTSVGRQLL